MIPVEGARMPAVAMVIRAGGTASSEAEVNSRPGTVEGDDDSLEVNYLYNCRPVIRCDSSSLWEQIPTD